MASLLSPASLNTGEAVGDQYISIEGLIGSNFADTLVGDESANTLQGLDGNDYMQGRGGVDNLFGGNGNDRLEGGALGDALDGGAGTDYAQYYYSSSAVTVDLMTPASNTGDAAGDTFVSIEGIIATQFNDVLYGDNNANDFAAWNGNDTVEGRGGNDNLQGMDGNDTLNGGAGVDTLTGGAGDDKFVFFAGEAEGDTVTDFNGNGINPGDVLEFHGYGPGATFMKMDATHGVITYNAGASTETIVFMNGASVDASDYTFI
jgi:Ca2+-binding RTX toxin-like protein